MQITEDAPIDVATFRSPIDGALVVQIDTNAETGRVRVNLNEAPVYDGDPDSDENAVALLVNIASLVIETNDGIKYPTNAEGDAVLRERLYRILRSNSYLK